MSRVKVKPELLRWAYERAGLKTKNLIKRFPKLKEWESGETNPTYKQLQAFADATYAPMGYLFSDKPPAEEKIPIPDLRTIGNKQILKPSLNLIDTIYLCERRQDWYQKYIRSEGYEKLPFVGSVSIRNSAEKAAEKMRQTLGFTLESRKQAKTWEDALQLLRRQADDVGILVMMSGVVGNNSKRKLKVDEFRGFALSDDFAPLIFINSQDFKSAQIFTLAHELAHIWLGESALSNVSLNSTPTQTIEVWCNKVAAELLVPLKSIKKDDVGSHPIKATDQLAKKYKVSGLVILRRLLDANYIKKKEFDKAYQNRLAQIQSKKLSQSSGGDFYRTIEARTNKRFIQDLITSTLEGKTLFTEAFHLLDIKKTNTFQKIVKDQLGIIWE